MGTKLLHLYNMNVCSTLAFSRIAGFSRSSVNDSGRTLFRKGESSKMSQTGGLQNSDPALDSENNDAEHPDNVDKSKENPASSDTRLKGMASFQPSCK